MMLAFLSTQIIFQFVRSAHESSVNRYIMNVDELQEEKMNVIDFDSKHVHKDDTGKAKILEKKIRILCWVLTDPYYLQKKAKHVKLTWGKRCNLLLFFSSVTNKTFPTIGLNVSEGRDHLTSKTRQAFKYVYDHYIEDADWFLKADDDTYIVVENLRYFLQSFKSHDPIYFGHHFHTIVKQGYHSGGAGYVLSNEAVRRLNNIPPHQCRQDGGAEDAEIGKCLEIVNVKTANSTDSLGRSRFHCFVLERHLTGDYPDWYYKYDANGAKQGIGSVSDYAISFHKLKPQEMYAFEYYLYHLRLWGVRPAHQELNLQRTH